MCTQQACACYRIRPCWGDGPFPFIPPSVTRHFASHLHARRTMYRARLRAHACIRSHLCTHAQSRSLAGPIPFSKTVAANSMRDPIVGDHERNSKPPLVAFLVMCGVLICGTIIYVSVTQEYDSTQIYNADPSQLQALLKGSGIELPTDAASSTAHTASLGGSGEGEPSPSAGAAPPSAAK